MDKRVDHMLDLSRMLIDLNDPDLTSKNCLAALFALCRMTDKTPQQVAENLFKNLPDDQEWQDDILPTILDYPDDYEEIT